jgi:hypothetical protein
MFGRGKRVESLPRPVDDQVAVVIQIFERSKNAVCQTIYVNIYILPLAFVATNSLALFEMEDSQRFSNICGRP